MLEQEEKRGLVDPVGLGMASGIETEMTAHAKRVKGKGVTLVGRREGTVRVLTEEMADLVRRPLCSSERAVLTRRIPRSDRSCRR